MKKRIITILLSIILVATITVGTTFAYLSTTTDDKDNVFTVASKRISAKLLEPNWESTKALGMVPGLSVNKDPRIYNSCELTEAVFIRLSFQDKNGDPLSGWALTKLVSLLLPNFNTTDWANIGTILDPINPEFIFRYVHPLAPGTTTIPLFDWTELVSKLTGNITEADLRWLQGIKIVNGDIVDDSTGLKSCNIKLEGAAVEYRYFQRAQSGGAAAMTEFYDTVAALFP